MPNTFCNSLSLFTGQIEREWEIERKRERVSEKEGERDGCLGTF
jgi:hypothetical protein